MEESRAGPAGLRHHQTEQAQRRQPRANGQLLSPGMSNYGPSGGVLRDVGDMDYLLRIQVADLAHFSRFAMDTLMHILAVVDCEISSLQQIRKTTELRAYSVVAVYIRARCRVPPHTLYI